MKLNLSRSVSFFIIFVIYAIAAAVGIAVYSVLPCSPWLKLLLADVVATLVTFVFSVALGNASVYDPYWSIQPIVIVVGLSIGAEMTLYRILLLAVICFWGVRLTANWAYTFHGLGHQDWRYTMLREKTGKFYPIINLIGIHMVPTLVVYACTLPAAYAFWYPLDFYVFRFFFLAVSLFAAVLQGVADCQMHAFRRSGKGGFIREGLWEHSRHPNYLGEILMWWGVALSLTVPNIDLWYLSAGAVANTCLFAFVSIPMSEARQARKEGFEQYRAQTRVLLPVKK